MRAKFGVLWDREKNPYCPKCRILLQPCGLDKDKNEKLCCLKCEHAFYLIDENGTYFKLAEARCRL